MTRSAIAAFAILVACKGGKSKQQCQIEDDELVRWMKAIPRSPRVDPALHLASRTDLPHRELAEGPSVQIGADAIHYRGMLVADARDLAERLRPDGSGHLYLAIDAKAAWGVVVAVAAAAHGRGFDKLDFLFADRSAPKPEPPPTTRIDAKLDALGKDDTAERATALATMIREVVKPCAPLDKAFQRVGGIEGDKTAYLVEAIHESLIECDCNVDLPELRSAMWQVLYDPTPVGALSIRLDGKGESIRHPAARTWEQAQVTLALDRAYSLDVE